MAALLRGVNNIGAAKRIAMADLRALVESLGFRDVRTLLNSGNVVFSVPHHRRGEVADRISKALEKSGIKSRVTILSKNEVAAVIRDNPFADLADNPSWLLVMVMRRPSDRGRLKPLLEKTWHPEALALGKRVAYIWCANGVADSTLWPAVDRALEGTGTTRNMATMARLLALVGGTQ
ncbi:MAG: DUF1697 domain-containing protein [Candidatus Polarisedimenticolia bacterium]